VTGEELGHAVHHHVDAGIEGALEKRGGEGIVHRHPKPEPMGSGGE